MGSRPISNPNDCALEGGWAMGGCEIERSRERGLTYRFMRDRPVDATQPHASQLKLGWRP